MCMSSCHCGPIKSETPQPQPTVFSKNLFFFWRLFWAQCQEGHCWTPSKTPSSRKRSHSAIRTERADRVDLPAVDWKCGPEHTGRAPFDAKTRKGKIARTRSKETARARTPRMRKDSELMGIGTLEMEAPTKGLFVGRDKCAEWKLTLKSSRMWIQSPSRHRCQWRHQKESQTRTCQMT